jgi:hypothetical protein
MNACATITSDEGLPNLCTLRRYKDIGGIFDPCSMFVGVLLPAMLGLRWK